MIDINELRRLAQAATPHVGRACKYQDAHWLREGHVDFENADLFIASERPQEDAAFYAAANPTTVIEILDRLEDAESDALEQARLNGMGSEREAALMAKLEAAERERDECNRRRLEAADHFAAQTTLMKKKYDALRAKIAEMEQQEPVAEWTENRFHHYPQLVWNEKYRATIGAKLYLAPGAQAQPAASVPSDEYVGWYCAHCERGVDASEVTYHEQHQACGRVITDDRPPRHSPSVPNATWLPVPDKHPTFDPVDLQLADGSVLCGCVPQSDGDYWWEGPSGEVFIDPKYANVTHWRLAAAPEAKP